MRCSQCSPESPRSSCCGWPPSPRSPSRLRWTSKAIGITSYSSASALGSSRSPRYMEHFGCGPRQNRFDSRIVDTVGQSSLSAQDVRLLAVQQGRKGRRVNGQRRKSAATPKGKAGDLLPRTKVPRRAQPIETIHNDSKHRVALHRTLGQRSPSAPLQPPLFGIGLRVVKANDYCAPANRRRRHSPS